MSMGVVSRELLPACEKLCFICPSLRTRSRHPVERYKKLLAEIFPRTQVTSFTNSQKFWSYIVIYYFYSLPIITMYQGQYNVALFEILYYSYCFYLAHSVTHSTSTKVFVVDMEAIIVNFLLSLYFQEWTHNYKNICFVESLHCEC